MTQGGDSPLRTIRRPGAAWRSGPACFGLGVCAMGVIAAGLVWPGEAPVATDVLLKVKPSVVIVTTKISGEVRLTCPNGSSRRVVPEPIQEHGTGFLITADG